MEVAGRSFLVHIVILLILLAINAVVSASEIAFLSLSQQNIKDFAKEGNKKAYRVLKLVEDPDFLISSLQSTITLTEVIAAVNFSLFMFSRMGSNQFLNGITSAPIRRVIIILILTTLFIVLGEKLPKRIAVQMPDQIAMNLSGIVSVLRVIIKPYVWLINLLTLALEKLLPMNFDESSERFTRDEMQAILVESHSEGSIDSDEYTMLEGVLSLDEKMAKEIMVPRTDAQMINIDDDIEENIDEILESPYSRIPLYKEDRDNVIGILHTKTLLKLLRTKDEERINLLSVSYDPLFVPATMYIDDLLVEFKRHQQHMAILIDEYGGVEGIVTMEDLLEEIVGDIDDENDIEKIGEIRRIDVNNAFVNAKIDIDEFNEYYGLAIDEEDIDTLAGAIIREIGYVPKETERIRIRVRDYVIQTLRVESGRIYTVKVTFDPGQAIETEYIIEELPMAFE